MLLAPGMREHARAGDGEVDSPPGRCVSHVVGALQAAISTLDVDGGIPLGVAVAAVDLEPGEVAMSIPESLCVTLDNFFEDVDTGEGRWWTAGWRLKGEGLYKIC